MKIIPHLKAITNLISENLVSQIEAETGTGKSIMIPGTLASEKGYTVYISVPRVTSAITLSEFEKRTFNTLSIGYGANGDIKYNYSTKVVYATAGHLRRKILSLFRNGRPDLAFAFCDVLIMDEVHVGSIDNTIIMSMWNYVRSTKFNVPKIVLLTATPTDTFLTPEADIYYISIERPYPVQLYYHDVISDSSNPLPVYYKAIEVILNTDVSKGDILVFAHGMNEVKMIIGELQKLLPPNENYIIGAYASMRSEDIDKIYKPSPNGERKIIVATNMVESSITIDGLGVVIDTLLENRAFTSGTGGLRLNTVHISKDSAKQRLGRTGRTRAGECHRIISEEDYNDLSEHIEPEIKRIPIHEIVMELISAKLDPLEIIHDVEMSKVKGSIDLLQDIGAIVDGNVTELGHFLPKVPLSVRNGAFLYRWIESGYEAFPGIVMASIIDVYTTPGYFYIPERNRDEKIYHYSDRLRKHFSTHITKFMGRNILHTFYRVWTDFSKSMMPHTSQIFKTGLFTSESYPMFKSWAEASSINMKKWRELLNIVKQTLNVINAMPIEQIPGGRKLGIYGQEKYTTDAVKILSVVYRGERMHKNFGNRYIHEKTMLMHILNTRNPISFTETNELPEYIICINSAEIKGKHICNFSLPYELTDEELYEITSSNANATTYEINKVKKSVDELVKMQEDFRPKEFDEPDNNED